MVSEKPAKTVKPLNKREKNVIFTIKPNSNWIQLFFTLAKCVSILCCLTIFHDGIFAHFQYHVSRIFFVYLFNVSNRRRVKNRKSFFYRLIVLLILSTTISSNDGEHVQIHKYNRFPPRFACCSILFSVKNGNLFTGVLFQWKLKVV